MIDLVTLREFLFRRKHLSQVRHITLNPGGPGVVRLHMLPPASRLRRSVPYVVILNGHDVLPLNYFLGHPAGLFDGRAGPLR